MPLDEAVKAKLLKQVLTFTQSGCLWHRSQTRGRLLCAHDCTLVSQIEFYFSESNLPRDKFLLETVSRDPDGFVSLGLLCTFSRMRALLRLADGTKEDKVHPATCVTFCAAGLKCCVFSHCIRQYCSLCHVVLCSHRLLRHTQAFRAARHPALHACALAQAAHKEWTALTQCRLHFAKGCAPNVTVRNC